jgi:hypothetical protein
MAPTHDLQPSIKVQSYNIAQAQDPRRADRGRRPAVRDIKELE